MSETNRMSVNSKRILHSCSNLSATDSSHTRPASGISIHNWDVVLLIWSWCETNASSCMVFIERFFNQAHLVGIYGTKWIFIEQFRSHRPYFSNKSTNRNFREFHTGLHHRANVLTLPTDRYVPDPMASKCHLPNTSPILRDFLHQFLD